MSSLKENEEHKARYSPGEADGFTFQLKGTFDEKMDNECIQAQFKAAVADIQIKNLKTPLNQSEEQSILFETTHR